MRIPELCARGGGYAGNFFPDLTGPAPVAVRARAQSCLGGRLGSYGVRGRWSGAFFLHFIIFPNKLRATHMSPSPHSSSLLSRSSLGSNPPPRPRKGQRYRRREAKGRKSNCVLASNGHEEDTSQTSGGDEQVPPADAQNRGAGGVDGGAGGRGGEGL